MQEQLAGQQNLELQLQEPRPMEGPYAGQKNGVETVVATVQCTGNGCLTQFLILVGTPFVFSPYKSLRSRGIPDTIGARCSAYYFSTTHRSQTSFC